MSRFEIVTLAVMLLCAFVGGVVIGGADGMDLERSAWTKGERRLVDGKVWLKTKDGWTTREALKEPPSPARPEKTE